MPLSRKSSSVRIDRFSPKIRVFASEIASSHLLKDLSVRLLKVVDIGLFFIYNPFRHIKDTPK